MYISRIVLGFIGLFYVIGVYSMPVFAQEGQEAQRADEFLAKREKMVQTEQGQAEIVIEQDESTLARRVELAQEMHSFRSTREQVDSAVRRAAQSLPPQEREPFIMAMTSVLNYNAIERISVDAMAETFTVEELEAMVEYYNKPETQDIARKTAIWGQKVQPEIVRMIDKAMMRVRTGAPK